jgi:CDP-glucose 4,6-dehydratase
MPGADAAFWRGRRVLLTGHTGFKGAWLALWLTHLGARVTGLSTPPPTTPSLYEEANVGECLQEEVLIDVRRGEGVAEAMADVDVVFHLAAQAVVRAALADPVTTWETNVVGTANVLQAAAEARPKAVVVVTSDKCYRDVDTGRPMREDDALGGADPYSASKAGQELVAAAHRELLRDSGVAVATARAGNVIGGGDRAADRLVPDLVRAAAAGRPLVLRNPDAVRPWQHVLNPLGGYLLLARRLVETGAGGGYDEAWNFGPPPEDARPVSWVVERLRERWPGRPPDVCVEPDPDAAMEAPTLRLDSTKARERLGWTPGWNLAEGLDRTVEWYAGAGDPRERTVRQISAFT